ncbi:hypothetical protein QQS21_010429 [Conoideocrella luteorostrata]|uniref:Uncharacterized protein n=1 Tax=Conoideocrella luteorostrata TaxID=1105319 RepID=A0AAJ0CHQ3_9HYPO|nr:hypothetical protein QQS21_010429 [Conoideocrella luteorostrata]
MCLFVTATAMRTFILIVPFLGLALAAVAKPEQDHATTSTSPLGTSPPTGDIGIPSSLIGEPLFEIKSS